MKTSLLILGILHRGDFHPYEIKRRLEAAMIGCFIEEETGKLYYAIRQLEKDALIATVAQERVARGGIRTIYRITATGRAEFVAGLHKQFAEEGPVSRTLYAALLFLHLADLEVVEPIIRSRIARLDDLIAKLAPLRRELNAVLSTGGQHLFGHLEQQRQLDRAWLQKLLAVIESGDVVDIPDAAQLARRAEN